VDYIFGDREDRGVSRTPYQKPTSCWDQQLLGKSTGTRYLLA